MFNSLPADNVYHKVLAIILDNIYKIPEMSLEAVAQMTFSSVTTISRLLQKLNCVSFRDFKSQIKKVLDGYALYNRVFPYEKLMSSEMPESYFSYFHSQLNKLEELVDYELIGKLSEKLHAADSIHLYMQYAQSPAKRQFQTDLVVSGKTTVCLDDVKDQLEDISNLCRDSFVISTSAEYYPHYTDHIAVLKSIREKGASLLVISPVYTPNVRKYADYLLEYDRTGTGLDNFFIDIIINLLDINYRSKYID